MRESKHFSALPQFDFYMQVQDALARPKPSATVDFRETKSSRWPKRSIKRSMRQRLISQQPAAPLDANATPRLPLNPSSRPPKQPPEAKSVSPPPSPGFFFEPCKRYTTAQLWKAVVLVVFDSVAACKPTPMNCVAALVMSCCRWLCPKASPGGQHSLNPAS